MTLTDAPRTETSAASAATAPVARSVNQATILALALTWAIVGFGVMVASARYETGIQAPLFVLGPLWIALFTAVVPGEVGSSSVAFPRIHAFGAWLVAGGGLLAVLAPGSDTLGREINDELQFVGRSLACVGLVAGAGTLLITVVALRRGVRMSELPLTSWTALVTSGAIVLAIPAVGAGALLQYLAVRYGHSSPALQLTGLPGLNELFGRPLTYLGVAPGLGVASAVVASSTGKRLPGELLVKVLLVAVAFLGIAASVNNNDGEFARPGAIALLPVPVIVLAWAAALASARRIPLRIGFLFVVGGLVLAFGGAINALTGGTWTIARVDGAAFVAPLLIVLGAAHELVAGRLVRPLSWASGVVAVPTVTIGGALLVRRMVNGISTQLVGVPSTSIHISRTADNLGLGAVFVGCTFVLVDLILAGQRQRAHR